MVSLEKIAKKVVEIPVLLLFLCITLAGAFCSGYLQDGYGQKLFFVRDSLLLNLAFAALFTGIIRGLTEWVCKNYEKRIRWLVAAVLGFTFCISLGFAAVSKCFPTADQASVYYGAKHFAADYFGDLAEKASYFSCYPHQMGLALFYEVLFRLFHTESFHLLQGVNALCNVMTVWSLWQITMRLSGSRKAGVSALLLSALCMPLLWYTPFVYGELPSFAFSLFGFAMLLIALGAKKKRSSLLFASLSLVSLVLATLVRKNTLILIIAVVLTLGIYVLRTKKYSYFFYLGLLVLLCSQAIPFAIRLYEIRSGVRLNDGVPGISHAVMGLQESEYAPGWYNGFNFTTYAYEADYDQEEAVRLSRLALEERLAVFRKNPAYTARFFWDKFRAEWLNTGYACYDYTAGKYYTRLPFVESLFSGRLFYITRFYMDKYQFMVYLLALLTVSAFLNNKKKEAAGIAEKKAEEENTDYGILRHTLLATILGGALFYLVWEGSGRYILPYFLMTLPYAGMAIAKLPLPKRKAGKITSELE